MAFSYSFHLSSRGHAVGTIGKVGQISKHNLRAYKSEDYDKNMISVIKGSNVSVLDSVKVIYEKEFSAALEEYNSKKRADRQIHDYLEHVSQSR
ncbi:MAG: mobilization protein, partial [Lachnospiraceae bacterium]|nr:mobilization protein [Lachnospiraceae bacterium]